MAKSEFFLHIFFMPDFRAVITVLQCCETMIFWLKVIVPSEIHTSPCQIYM